MSRRHKNDYSPDVGKRQRIDSIPEPRRGSPYVRTPHLRPCHDEEEAGFLRFSNGFDHNCHSQSSEELPEVLIVPHIPDSLDSYARDKVLLDFSFVQFYIRPLTATYFLKTNCFIWSLSNTVLEVRDGSLEILFICMSSCSSAGFSNGGAVWGLWATNVRSDQERVLPSAASARYTMHLCRFEQCKIQCFTAWFFSYSSNVYIFSLQLPICTLLVPLWMVWAAGPVMLICV